MGTSLVWCKIPPGHGGERWFDSPASANIHRGHKPWWADVSHKHSMFGSIPEAAIKGS